MTHYYAIGDIHGDFRAVRNFTQRNIKLHKDVTNGDDNVLVCLGDFGGNFFFNHRDEAFKSKLGKYPFTYFVIRGNHEERPSICREKNPNKWHLEAFLGNTVYVEDAYPYIKYALDTPAVYTIAGMFTFVIPGAYSVDKYKRLECGWSWFENEQLNDKEMELGLHLVEHYNKEFDLVLSHTCPICFEPTDLFLSCVDQSMVDKTMERYLGSIEYNIKYKHWLWGHYHANRIYPDGKCIMLFEQALDLEALKKEEVLYEDLI